MAKQSTFLKVTLINILIIETAIIIIGSIFAVKTTEFMKTALLTFSSALVASLFASMFLTKFVFKTNAFIKLFTKWGLIQIYKTKKYSLKDIDKEIKDTVRTLDIVTLFYDATFFNYVKKKILKKLDANFKVRIIIPKSSSILLKEIEDENKLEKASLSNHILEINEKINTEVYTKIDKHEFLEFLPSDSINLKFYVKTDSMIFVSPNFDSLVNNDSLIYKYENDSQGFEYYSSFFEKLWVTGK